MRQLSWRMEPEPPAPYITFVAEHLPELTTEAARLAGDDAHADLLYQEALEDVAARWSWLQLQASLGAGQDVRESYLRRSLSAHAQRWRDQQLYPVEVLSVAPHEPTAYERLRSGPTVPQILDSTDPSARPTGPTGPASPPPATPWPPQAAWVSVALRQAEHVGDTVRDEASPIAEATIAWWHAYERRRRMGRAGVLIGLVLFLMLLLRVGEYYAGA
ncbi:MAG TPA: hypothetical protein VF755_01740 [Catenuloplanes sp.]|jgi:hypothetical protein